ncbi:hypothetical protein C4K04_0249 [Pseudomonas chlororaphis]|uniref:Uncharacterized protein n=1 Tax=Pseudomonas chlororaphis TaxID=587753 RepID=A0A3G7TFT5_9PSED|nr:hypothetical protein C4K04_0249 [Pseudomonas chlororaphis]
MSDFGVIVRIIYVENKKQAAKYIEVSFFIHFSNPDKKRSAQVVTLR